MASSTYDSFASQRTYAPAEAPPPPNLNPTEAFSLGYDAVYSESMYGSGNMILSQYAANRREALNLGLEVPEIRTKSGTHVEPEQFSRYFSGEENDVSPESVQAYDEFVKNTRKKYPNSPVKSLTEIWQDTQTAAQQYAKDDQEARFGVVGGAAYLTGGIAAFMADPVNAATSLIGMGPLTGARTVATVAKVAAAEGGIQAAVEAGQEIRGQAAQRERLGLDGSLKSSMSRIGQAFVFGGVLRGAAEGVGAGYARLFADDDIPIEPRIRKEAPTPQALDAIERTKHEALAAAMDPRLTRNKRGTGAILRDMEDVRVVADRWDAPPMWSDEFRRTAAMPKNVDGVSVDTTVRGMDEVAREIEPDVFRVYDTLAARVEQLRADLNASRTDVAATDVDYVTRIAEANDKVSELTDAIGNRRLKKKEREELVAQREQAMADRDALMGQSRTADTPSQAALREELQQADYKMRDMIPEVQRAYARARGDMIASAKTNDAVKNMVKSRSRSLSDEDVTAIIDEAEKGINSAPSYSPDDMLRAKMGNAVPEGDETLADALIRVLRQDIDYANEQLESFSATAFRVLDDEEGKIVIGETEMSLNDTVYLATDEEGGFKKSTVREMLEEMRNADEDMKAVTSCSI